MGNGIKLPYQLLNQDGNLWLHQRMPDNDLSLRERVGLMRAALRSVAAMEATRELNGAFLARSQAAATNSAMSTYQLGYKVFYRRCLGNAEAKKQWAERWRGPAVWHEANNLWLGHRSLTIKASAGHARAARSSEVVDWKGIFERVMKTKPDGEKPAWWSPPPRGSQDQGGDVQVDNETPCIIEPPPADLDPDQAYLDVAIDEHG